MSGFPITATKKGDEQNDDKKETVRNKMAFSV
jgi:hypothetical protein